MSDHEAKTEPTGWASALTGGLELERGLAAEILYAARADHCIRFARAKNAWDEAKLPATTPIAKAVQELRDSWYHDGKTEQVERCRKAMTDLGTVLRSNSKFTGAEGVRRNAGLDAAPATEKE